MRFPTIHSNGTGFETLHGEYFDAYQAVGNAIEKLGKVTVHGRDYYVQGSDADTAAFMEHHTRLRNLQTIKTDLELIILNLEVQKDKQT